MTRDEAKQWIPILQAYADGKQLQSNVFGSKWADADEWSFGYPPDCYRIKPEPTYRPWTEQEIEAECIKGTVLKSKADYEHGQRIGVLSLVDAELYVGTNYVADIDDGAGEWLLKWFVIAATGAPCGVLE